MTPVRIKTTHIATTREGMWLRQGGKCALCSLHCTAQQAVLDHDHSTGSLRGVLHRSCNALLGKVENNFRRYGLQNLAAWAQGMPGYLRHHHVNRTGLLHPTYKSADEKRVRRNTLARKRRATKGTA